LSRNWRKREHCGCRPVRGDSPHPCFFLLAASDGTRLQDHQQLLQYCLPACLPSTADMRHSILRDLVEPSRTWARIFLSSGISFLWLLAL
jgi:hypothetical protein